MTQSDVQTSLRLPEELRDRLAQAATENGRGIGEEMRRRLEASFGSVPTSEDQKTSQLLRVIARSAAILVEHWALWHEDAGAWAVFRGAIEDVLTERRPEATGAVPKTERGASLFKSAPEQAGSTLAFVAEIAEGLI